MPERFKVDVDTSGLMFDPNKPSFFDDICREIKEFGDYENPHAPHVLSRVRIFSWVVLMYDMHSPIRREIKDLYKRKIYAGTLVGLNSNKISGKYKEWVEKMLIGADKKVNKLVAKYISHFASQEYMQMIAHAEIQSRMLEKIISGKATKETQIMFDTSVKTLKELTGIIYGTGERDEVYDARKALYKQVSSDLSDMRMERIATQMSKGENMDALNNPYDEGYEPGDIHFAGDDPSIAIDDEV